MWGGGKSLSRKVPYHQLILVNVWRNALEAGLMSQVWFWEMFQILNKREINMPTIVSNYPPIERFNYE